MLPPAAARLLPLLPLPLSKPSSRMIPHLARMKHEVRVCARIRDSACAHARASACACSRMRAALRTGMCSRAHRHACRRACICAYVRRACARARVYGSQNVPILPLRLFTATTAPVTNTKWLWRLGERLTNTTGGTVMLMLEAMFCSYLLSLGSSPHVNCSLPLPHQCKHSACARNAKALEVMLHSWPQANHAASVLIRMRVHSRLSSSFTQGERLAAATRGHGFSN